MSSKCTVWRRIHPPSSLRTSKIKLNKIKINFIIILIYYMFFYLKYWRRNEESTSVFFCSKNPSACKGNDTCSIGYKGILCEACDSL